MRAQEVVDTQELSKLHTTSNARHWKLLFIARIPSGKEEERLERT